MAAIAPIKVSGVLVDSASIATAPLMSTVSATVGIDISTAGSPGNLDPEGFNPNGIATWKDRSCGIAIGMPTFTLSIRSPVKGSRVSRIVAKYVDPKMEATSPSTSTGIQPAPTKSYELVANMEFIIPERATLAERAFFFSRVASLFAARVQASDASPIDSTGSPLPGVIITLDKPF